MLFLAFFLLLFLRTVAAPFETAQAGTYHLTGTIAEMPDTGKTRVTVELRNVTLDGCSIRSRVSVSVPLCELYYGDTLELDATLKPAERPLTAAYTHVIATGRSKTVPTLLAHHDDLYGALLRLRASLGNALDVMYRDQAHNARSMFLGDRSRMPYELTERYANNGILHIFAVSGMHMTVLISLAGSIIRIRNRWLHLLSILLVSAFYCALTAFTPSVLRAMFFLIGLQIANIRDRQPDPPSAYCFSVAAILLLRPYSLYTAGFLLSFGAMAGMILLVQPFTNLLHLPQNRWSGTLIGAMAAMIGIIPLQAYLFTEVPWTSIPMSLALVPVLPILMPFGFFSMFLYPFFPHIATGISLPPYGAFVLIDRLTSWLNAAPISVSKPPIASIVLYGIGLVLCSQLYLPARRRPPYEGFCSVAASILLWILFGA